MKRLYLDCEFNGFAGELISLALVDGEGVEEYMAADNIHGMAVNEWVKENVLPVLDGGGGWNPQRRLRYRGEAGMAVGLVQILGAVASGSGVVEVLADHPADFRHLFTLLDIWSAHNDFAYIPFRVRALLVESGELDSKVPHNALEDALALARWCKANGL